MRPLGSRYIWLKLTLAVGSLLGLLLLVQSVITYYQVSRLLITAELRKEAQQHVASIEREARRFGIRNPAELSQVLEAIRQDPPGTIAWIRIVDMAGHPLAQSGNSAGLPFRHERLQQALDGFTAVSEIRQMGTRKVLVTVLALRLARRPPVSAAPRDPDRGSLPRPFHGLWRWPSTSTALPQRSGVCGVIWLSARQPRSDCSSR